MVTGGLGFIGSNLTHALVAAVASVAVIDALVPGHGGSDHNIAGLDVDVLRCEIGDPAVRDVLRDADVVFNLAGQVSHIDSMDDPLLDLHLNATTHAAFLEHLRAVNPTARVVHTSTRQVYGVPTTTPVAEDHPAHPVDVNGVAKLAGEQLHIVYANAHSMPITSLRLTNVYGPRQRLTSDRLGFLPVFFRMALLDQPIRIFGDGTQRRDCLHVSDVVDAIVAATDDRLAGQVLNVGSPRDESLGSIAKLIVDATGSTGGFTFVPWPPEQQRIDIGSFRTDSTRLSSAVGWQAKIDLTDGVADTVDFYRGDPWYLSST
ncbi:MAG: NAD-dependent epimerase/dehydratase [Ilumatobacteraceae bacterium]|nr:NAD-dependent epimerase/dehydratase [Ilumatobacteraceae bacterium]